ncbi:hypothetical protein BDP27DRAFT_1141058, partial [Rhodocollybia butyracea]
FHSYLCSMWMSEDIVKMWSAVYRGQRTIFKESDTNMLIEAYHHVLKSKFLHGKRNRRADHLVHTLVVDLLEYCCSKQQRQDNLFEGPNLE